MNKKKLSIILSKLKVFAKPDAKLEQYPTDSEIAGEMLWLAHMLGDVDGRIIADLGSGTGMLGLGALILGANKVIFVDIDTGALAISKENLSNIELLTAHKYDADFVCTDISGYANKCDVVIMNPPFGTRNKGADAKFLLKAMTLAPIIYSFHKLSTREYIDKIIEKKGFTTTHHLELDFPLKSTMAHHSKKIERIAVGLWRIEKKHAVIPDIA